MLLLVTGAHAQKLTRSHVSFKRSGYKGSPLLRLSCGLNVSSKVLALTSDPHGGDGELI